MSAATFIAAFVLMVGLMLIGIPIAVSMVMVGAVGGLLAFGTHDQRGHRRCAL